MHEQFVAMRLDQTLESILVAGEGGGKVLDLCFIHDRTIRIFHSNPSELNFIYRYCDWNYNAARIIKKIGNRTRIIANEHRLKK